MGAETTDNRKPLSGLGRACISAGFALNGLGVAKPWYGQPRTDLGYAGAAERRASIIVVSEGIRFYTERSRMEPEDWADIAARLALVSAKLWSELTEHVVGCRVGADPADRDRLSDVDVECRPADHG